MKVFISQPMKDKSKEEILDTRGVVIVEEVEAIHWPED